MSNRRSSLEKFKLPNVDIRLVVFQDTVYKIRCCSRTTNLLKNGGFLCDDTQNQTDLENVLKAVLQMGEVLHPVKTKNVVVYPYRKPWETASKLSFSCDGRELKTCQFSYALYVEELTPITQQKTTAAACTNTATCSVTTDCVYSADVRGCHSNDTVLAPNEQRSSEENGLCHLDRDRECSQRGLSVSTDIVQVKPGKPQTSTGSGCGHGQESVWPVEDQQKMCNDGDSSGKGLQHEHCDQQCRKRCLISESEGNGNNSKRSCASSETSCHKEPSWKITYRPSCAGRQEDDSIKVEQPRGGSCVQNNEQRLPDDHEAQDAHMCQDITKKSNHFKPAMLTAEEAVKDSGESTALLDSHEAQDGGADKSSVDIGAATESTCLAPGVSRVHTGASVDEQCSEAMHQSGVAPEVSVSHDVPMLESHVGSKQADDDDCSDKPKPSTPETTNQRPLCPSIMIGTYSGAPLSQDAVFKKPRSVRRSHKMTTDAEKRRHVEYNRTKDRDQIQQLELQEHMRMQGLAASTAEKSAEEEKDIDEQAPESSRPGVLGSIVSSLKQFFS